MSAEEEWEITTRRLTVNWTHGGRIDWTTEEEGRKGGGVDRNTPHQLTAKKRQADVLELFDSAAFYIWHQRHWTINEKLGAELPL